MQQGSGKNLNDINTN